MGIALLFLRIGVGESILFRALLEKSHIKMGDFGLIFQSRERLWRYVWPILSGVPIWYVVGVLVTFSPELFTARVDGQVQAGQSILYAYIGLAVGDLIAGLLSQAWRSRKRPVLVWLSVGAMLSILYNLLPLQTPQAVYAFCVGLGFFSGYWAVLLTGAAEQFGTNIRATVATSIPNWIRGSLVISTLLWDGFKDGLGLSGHIAALLAGVVVYGVAIVSALRLRETYGASLDFVET